MTDIPDFVTHYHRADRRPFLNLSDLEPRQVAEVLRDLASSKSMATSHRRFGPRYMRLRRATEARLRERFVERGGRPERASPHYFVLGESDWFRGLYVEPAAVRIPIADLCTDQVSFTIPDSITSMGLLGDLGIDLPVLPHHGQLYRIEELHDVIARHGRPNSPAPASYDGHQVTEFEHYVEVQVWSDEALGNPPGN